MPIEEHLLPDRKPKNISISLPSLMPDKHTIQQQKEQDTILICVKSSR